MKGHHIHIMRRFLSTIGESRGRTDGHLVGVTLHRRKVLENESSGKSLGGGGDHPLGGQRKDKKRANGSKRLTKVGKLQKKELRNGGYRTCKRGGTSFQRGIFMGGAIGPKESGVRGAGIYHSMGRLGN